MERYFKKFIRSLFTKLLYLFYSLLVKMTVKDKSTLPKRYVYDLYETFVSDDVKKIVMPYTEVDDFNRHNLNRPYEVLDAEIIDKKVTLDLNFDSTKDIALPLALLDESASDNETKTVDIKYGDKISSLELKHKNRFHYLPIKNLIGFDKLSIRSDDSKLAVGSPIPRHKVFNQGRPKLIVHIFVDALSKVLMDSFDEELMPATNSFFSKGLIFNNAYSQADWTLSSIAGVFSGKYTKDHLIYHPRDGKKIKDTVLAEVLKNNGYLTSMISSIPKLTPLNGFDRGFSRCVVAPFKSADFIINEAIEQLDAFGGEQYMFLGLFDAHEAHKLQPISSQLNNDLNDLRYKHTKAEKGLSINYDKHRIAMCSNTYRHLDSKLETLYQKIEQYDKDALVILHSDHGVDFITKNNFRLSNARQKVALMMRGGVTNSSIIESCAEIRMVSSLVLKNANIDNEIIYNHSKFVKTESIYPDQEYELAIRDSNYVLFFQVPWSELKDRRLTDYQFSARLCSVNNEAEELNNADQFQIMLKVAQEHYDELLHNLITDDAK